MPITAACLVPAAPLLLPRLTGTDVPEVTRIRQAVTRALAVLGGARPVVLAQRLPGSLAGFGAPQPGIEPVPATGSWPHELARALLAQAAVSLPEPVDLPLRWDSRGDDGSPRWLQELVQDDEPVALLLLADGSRTRGPKAPGGDDPRGELVDAELAAALLERRAADCPDAEAVGATAVAVTAVFAALPGGQVRVHHNEAPLGVCYLVATWQAGAQHMLTPTAAGA